MRAGSGNCTAASMSSTCWRRSSRERSCTCTAIASSTCRPIVSTGFSAVIGSWKIMAMRLPRSARMRSGAACNRSSPA